MALNKKFLTAESVTEGHPDKIADIIADAILDAILKNDKYARVASEVFISKGKVKEILKYGRQFY